MRNPVPTLRDEVAALKERLQHEHDGHKKPRLQMLYLLASGQAHERQAAARLLGVHRNTVGRWLALYAAGGLAAWLATYVPPGTPVSLAPAVLASLEEALRRPQGFASYEALRQWVIRTHGVQITYKTLSTLVRTRFRTKLKGAPTQSHKKPLRRCRRFKQLVMRNSNMPFPLRTAAPYGGSAKTKAALVCLLYGADA